MEILLAAYLGGMIHSLLAHCLVRRHGLPISWRLGIFIAVSWPLTQPLLLARKVIIRGFKA